MRRPTDIKECPKCDGELVKIKLVKDPIYGTTKKYVEYFCKDCCRKFYKATTRKKKPEKPDQTDNTDSK